MYERRRRRQIDNDNWYVAKDDDYYAPDEEPITEASDTSGADLSELDFSQVFGGGGGGGGGAGAVTGDGSGSDDAGSDFIDPRALHLIDLMSQPDNCLVRNILQIWDSDLERIRELDEQQILDDVNEALRNG